MSDDQSFKTLRSDLDYVAPDDYNWGKSKHLFDSLFHLVFFNWDFEKSSDKLLKCSEDPKQLIMTKNTLFQTAIGD